MRYVIKNLGSGINNIETELNKIMEKYPEGAPIGVFPVAQGHPLSNVYVVIDTIYYQVPDE